VGTRVRVRQEHRILERRGMVGKVVGRYGGEEYVVVDVRFSNGQRRLFWPGDLEEIASPGLLCGVLSWVTNAGARDGRAQASQVRLTRLLPREGVIVLVVGEEER
jgi:hypothetical protein